MSCLFGSCVTPVQKLLIPLYKSSPPIDPNSSRCLSLSLLFVPASWGGHCEERVRRQQSGKGLVLSCGWQLLNQEQFLEIRKQRLRPEASKLNRPLKQTSASPQASTASLWGSGMCHKMRQSLATRAGGEETEYQVINWSQWLDIRQRVKEGSISCLVSHIWWQGTGHELCGIKNVGQETAPCLKGDAGGLRRSSIFLSLKQDN